MSSGPPLVLVTVGQTRRGPLRELELDYVERIGRLAPVERAFVPASRKPRAADRVREEAAALSAHRAARGTAIALDARGRELDSDEFARALARWREGGPVAFFVGGPDGLDPVFVESCGTALALGAMTLPHELALVVLLEQLYRALASARNHPYSRH